ncbi:DNA binding domain-containing protein, excisionase family [Chryseobacterium oranimense]|uniref:DNA binding domain-containing protein, excisionase family n=1 Tax=Chryseobacterium oranimense TaxID=421058 RepID=A0A1M5X4A7_9FLAO|nr:helix-turn-helix domain-containing protein [Chryseobacterium oranimense]SHH94646.1 DNA binding domain-containing protein, excisionase family [Chryseobacterium oranimense]
MKNILILEITKQELLQELRDTIVKEIKLLLEDTDRNKKTLLTRKEVCELLDISESTLNRWTKDGRLVTHNKGNRVYYKRSDVEDF